MDNNTPHILFVDDDLNLLKTLGKIFKAKDFEVILAQTGGAALAYIERQPMSVVLIDLKLGDMSGLDVLRGVKAFSPDSECILLTGNASQASAIQAIQMGAFGYIQKPFEVDQIVLSVQRAADKYHSTLALRESEEKYRRLFDRASLGIFQSTPQGKVISVNPAFARMFGYDSIEDAVQSIRNVATDLFVDPNRRAEIIRMMEENPGLRSFENVYRRKDGSTFIGNLNTMPVMDTNRQLIRVEGIIEDITKRKQLETAKQAQLQISLFSDHHTLDELMQKTLDEAEVLTGSQIGFLHFLEPNQKILRLQMWSTNTIKNMCTAEGKGSHYPVDQAGVWTECVFTRAPIIHNDYPNLAHRKGLPQGHAPVLRELVVPVLRNDLIVMLMGVGNKPGDYDDNDVEVISQLANSVWDVVQRKQVEDNLKESEERFRLAFEHAHVGMTLVDLQGRFLKMNPQICLMFGYSQEELEGKSIKDITHPDYQSVSFSFIQQAVEGQVDHSEFEKLYIHKNGSFVWGLVSSSLVRNAAGEPVYFISHIQDITFRKQTEIELLKLKESLEDANRELQIALIREQTLSHTDVLTGIHNRRYLFELAVQKFAVASRYQQPLAVMMIDIDHFKKVNDTFGHIVGDQMLKNVTKIAHAELRSADVIGRYGGEEFVILLPMTNARQAGLLAERIRADVAALRLPTEKGDASATLSIGIVEINHKESMEAVEDVFRRADEAMYAAKQAGRNRVVIFNSPE